MRHVLPIAALALAASSALALPQPSGGAEPSCSLRYEHAPFEAHSEYERWLPGMQVWHHTLRSPVTTGSARNDTIHLYDYRPSGGARAAVLVLPIAAGPDLTLERTFAGYLAVRGIRALVMPLPYQHARNDGTARNVLSREGTVEDLRAFFRQGVLDAKHVRHWLEERDGLAPRRVGLVGISLGSFVAQLAYATDPGFGAAACLLGGGDLAAVIWNGSRETRRIKRTLIARGYDLAATREALAPVDPLTWADPRRGGGLLMINALDDEVIPRRCTWKLREAWGDPHFLSFPGNHYSVAVFLPVALEAVARHMRRELLER